MNEITSLTLQISDGDYAWTGTAETNDVETYQQTKIGDGVTFNLGGEAFRMRVYQKMMTRDGGLPRMQFGVISTTSLLAAPEAEPIPTIEWDYYVTAQGAAQQVAGQVIEWRMVDWIITPGRLSFTNATPMDVLKKITSAAGGGIITRPDGTLTAQPRFPISVPDWATAEVDFTLTDEEHILSSSETLANIARVNWVLVQGNLPSASTDNFFQIEFPPGDPIIGGEYAMVNVYNGPRVQGISLTATSGYVTYEGQGSPVLFKEDLHFTDATTAVLSHPPTNSTITAMTWYGEDLGTPTLMGDGRTISVPAYGNGILHVEYYSTPTQYRVSVPATSGGVTTYPVGLLAAATLIDCDTDSGEIYQRGDGQYPGTDISDPILTTATAREARGMTEINAGESLQEVVLGCVHLPGVWLGDLVEVHDSFLGVSWRGQVTSITHSAKIPTMRTSLRVLRHV